MFGHTYLIVYFRMTLPVLAGALPSSPTHTYNMAIDSLTQHKAESFGYDGISVSIHYPYGGRVG